MKAWSIGQPIDRNLIAKVLAEIKFDNLNLKFWGQHNLSKIAGMDRKPLAIDKATMYKSKTKYARVLIRMDIDAKLPESMTFVDEKGELVAQLVDFE